jgi:hypothetical protein
LVGFENLSCSFFIYMDTRHIPPFPVRPDHAVGVENFHPRDPCLVAGRRHLVADALEYLALKVLNHDCTSRTIFI